MMIGPTSRMLEAGQSEAVRATAAAGIFPRLCAAHAHGGSMPLGAAISIITAANPAREPLPALGASWAGRASRNGQVNANKR